MRRLRTLLLGGLFVTLALAGVATAFLVGTAAGSRTAVQAGPGSDATLVATPFSVAAGQFGSAVATCPPGARVVGGGVGTTGDLSTLADSVAVSEPLDSSSNPAETRTGDVGKSWFGGVVNLTTSTRIFKVFAICSASSDATLVAASFTVPGVRTADSVAFCPSGTRAVGGGFGPATDRSKAALAVVQVSGPLDSTGQTFNTTTGDAAASWYASVLDTRSDTPIDIKVFAICSKSSDATIVAANFTVFPKKTGDAAAYCPTGTRALGGGVGVSAGLNNDYLAAVQASGPLNAGGLTANTQSGDAATIWYASTYNAFPGDAFFFKVFAICAKPSAATTASSSTTRTAVTTTTSAPATTTTAATTTTRGSGGKPAAAKLTERLTGLSIVGHGKARSLHVTVSVSTRARAQLQLLRNGFERAEKIVNLHAGANALRLALPPTLAPGSYRLKVTVHSGKQQTTATALVFLAGRR